MMKKKAFIRTKAKYEFFDSIPNHPMTIAKVTIAPKSSKIWKRWGSNQACHRKIKGPGFRWIAAMKCEHSFIQSVHTQSLSSRPESVVGDKGLIWYRYIAVPDSPQISVRPLRYLSARVSEVLSSLALPGYFIDAFSFDAVVLAWAFFPAVLANNITLFYNGFGFEVILYFILN